MTDALDRLDALFTDEAADILSGSDVLTDRLVDIVQMGLDVIEAILLDGEEDTKITALTRILPLATKVAEKRQDASLTNIMAIARDMFLEVFPDRQSLTSPLGNADSDTDPDPDAPDEG